MPSREENLLLEEVGFPLEKAFKLMEFNQFNIERISVRKEIDSRLTLLGCWRRHLTPGTPLPLDLPLLKGGLIRYL